MGALLVKDTALAVGAAIAAQYAIGLMAAPQMMHDMYFNTELTDMLRHAYGLLGASLAAHATATLYARQGSDETAKTHACRTLAISWGLGTIFQFMYRGHFNDMVEMPFLAFSVANTAWYAYLGQ